MALPKFQYTLYEKRDRVALITLNRPKVMNAFVQEGYAEVKWALVEADMDPEVGVVIITGAGSAFSTGGDLRNVLNDLSDAQQARIGSQRYAEESRSLVRQMETMPKIIIAAINGYCYAGGLVVAICSDILIASERARFKVPEPMVGIADPFTAARLHYRIGLGRSKYLILTGKEIDAREALAMGLVNEVVPDESLMDAARQVAGRVMLAAPGARGIYKQMINRTLPGFEFVPHLVTGASDEAREGTRAFVEGREPNWRTGLKERR